METTINNEKHYTPKQASEHFGLSYATIYSACRNGRLACREINGSYMIAETAMLDYINQRKARITVPGYSEMSVDDLADELLKRIKTAYDKGYADGKKDAKQALNEAIRGLK
jgi:predicted site-specific integrase-resolvase